MIKLNRFHSKIKFHIDKVNYMKDARKVVITGWVFSDSNVDIQIKDKACTNIVIKRLNRTDVNDYFNIDMSDTGFIAEFNLLRNKSSIRLNFIVGNVKLQTRVKLFNRFEIFNKRSASDFYKFSKEYGIKNAISHTINLFLKGTSKYSKIDLNIEQQYELFIKKENTDREKVELKYTPKISILVPVYNVPGKWLCICLDSVINQTYSNWELCIVDDCSPNKQIQETLRNYASKDSRIKYMIRKQNGHISAASNDALKMATGEFIALLDHDDELSPIALEEVVKALNKNPQLDLIYTDEDKIDENGNRFDPHFKPDWSPDTFLSMNYICHFTVIRRDIMNDIGGFRIGYEGAQDYDLFLRVTEKTQNINHIPKILYHWRTLETSTAKDINQKGYACQAGEKAVSDALQRRGTLGKVHSKGTMYTVEYELRDYPRVSIIIPTKDYSDILEVCLESLYTKTTYKNFEVIVVNNNSSEDETFKLFKRYSQKYDNFRVIDNNIEFNYSKLNNDAITYAQGDYVVLLNNDIEVITPNWIELMLGFCQQEHIGAVGAKLLYPDNTVQHCGIVLGMGGVAGHSQKYASRNNVGYNGRLMVPYNYAAVTAACLMIKKSKYVEVNGLDEMLKVAFNDIDFNIKLLKLGYYNVVVPQVEMYHHESKSRGYEDTPEKVMRFEREIKYMHKKWSDFLKQDPFYNKNFSLDTDQIQIKVN